MKVIYQYPKGYGEYRIIVLLAPLEKQTLIQLIPLQLAYCSIDELSHPEIFESNDFQLCLCQQLERTNNEEFRHSRNVCIGMLLDSLDDLSKIMLWPISRK